MPSGKAAVSEEARCALQYVEPLSETRTKLPGLFQHLAKTVTNSTASVWVLPLGQTPTTSICSATKPCTKWMPVGWRSTFLSVRGQRGKPVSAWNENLSVCDDRRRIDRNKRVGWPPYSRLYRARNQGAPWAVHTHVQGTGSHRPGCCCCHWCARKGQACMRRMKADVGL
jgi:hypothetical protein